MSDAPNREPETRGSRSFRIVLGGVALAALLVVLVRSGRGMSGSPVAPPAPWLAAGACYLLALLAMARGWSALFPGLPGAPLRFSFYAGQVSKYVPGGVGQALAQVGLATDAGVALGRALTGFALFAVVVVVSGAFLGSAFPLGARPAAPQRWLPLAGLLLLPFLHRGWMVLALRWGHERWHRFPPPEGVPPQDALLRSFGWNVLGLAGYAVSFVVLLQPLDGRPPDLVACVPAFAASWTVGFLALPFPTGIGVREAALVALLGLDRTGPLVAAALAHRVLAMACEAALWAGHRARAGRGADAR